MKTVNGKEFDSGILRSGDRIDCSGPRFDPVACAIRAKTAGVKRMFDWKNVPSHTESGLIVQTYSMTVGMRPYKKTSYDCRLSPLREYDGKIISIYRYTALDKEPSLRADLAFRLVSDVNRKIRYDYAGLIQFLNERFKDAPQDYYCSEHHTMRLTPYEPALRRFVVKVSPQDLVRFSIGNPDKVKRVV